MIADSQERSQFRILFKLFLSRAIDVELLSPGASAQTLFIQIAALLSAFNFVFCVYTVPRYGISTLPWELLRVYAWGDEEFLIAFTLAAVGLFAVVAWDTLLPDLRDALVLGIVPVRNRTVASAKAAAVLCATLAIVVLVNIFTGICYAVVSTPAGAGAIGIARSFAAYWLTMILAGTFAICALVALQGLTAQMMPYRIFLRASSYIQFGSLALIIASFFLKPPLATRAALSDPSNWTWLQYLPSYWFLGLFQQMRGTTNPVFPELALRALVGVVLAVASAGAAFAFAYRRSVRRIVEQGDSIAGARIRISRLFDAFAALLFPTPSQRAVFLFTSRTLFRSRKHRLLLALYWGAGAAIALIYLHDLLPGSWNHDATQRTVSLLIASTVMLFFAIFGPRIAFTFPAALNCNWVFRVTVAERPEIYLSAVRRTLYVLTAVPACSIIACVFLIAWPLRAALMHIVFSAFLSAAIVEMSLRHNRKIPFACSYLPGKTNVNVTFVLYGTLILFLSNQVGYLELFALHSPAGFTILLLIMAWFAFHGRRSAREFERGSHTSLQFEDPPRADIQPLALDEDSAAESYITRIPDTNPFH